MASLKAFLAEQEVSDLTSRQKGVQWFPKLDIDPKEDLLQPPKLSTDTLSPVIAIRNTQPSVKGKPTPHIHTCNGESPDNRPRAAGWKDLFPCTTWKFDKPS